MQHTLTLNGAVAVVDSLGGEMVSYHKDGRAYAWEGDSRYWTGHAPVLFPIVCSLKEDKIRIGDHQLTIAKHGFARKNEFTAISAADDEVRLALEANDATLAVYPYRFRLITTHKLHAEGFSTTYRVENRDEREMIFCIGGHPGFNCPLGPEESFEDYALIFEKTEDNEPLLTDAKGILSQRRALGLLKNTDTLDLRYSDFDEDALMFDNLVSRSVKLVNKKTGRGIRFDFSGFPALGVWTPPKKHAPFICLEPWIGLPAFIDETGRFEDKPYAQTLLPGESLEAGYRVTILGST